jgi:phosphoribosylformimino-5-aminoimidazole carboxamide ribotide isomerase
MIRFDRLLVGHSPHDHNARRGVDCLTLNPRNQLRSKDMQIIPVLDLLDRVVVRGIAGNRSAYRPIVSRLVTRPDPLELARGFREQFGLSQIYVADLDAILEDRPSWNIYTRLCEEGFELLIDAGLRTIAGAQRVLECGVRKVVIGLETWPGPELLSELCREIDPERMLFSLDLKEGRPLGNPRAWQTDDPLLIAQRAIEAGAHELIVLDLASVGGGAGPSTVALCQAIQRRFPGTRLVTGGGVRHGDDLRELARQGIDGVLVASALHDGRLSRDDVARIMAANERVAGDSGQSAESLDSEH